MHHRNEVKTEVCGDRKGSPRPQSFLSFHSSEGMTPICDQGFVRSTQRSCPPLGRKAASKESAVYSNRLPKISHPVISRQSSPP
jgi:hypothetical protein